MKARREAAPSQPSAPYLEIPSRIGEGPRHSLSSRHERPRPETPGPSYVPPPLGTDGRGASLKGSKGSARDPKKEVPGPGTYSPSPRFARDAPKFTLHKRTGDVFGSTSAGPGPGAYSPDYAAGKARAPAPTLHGRPEPPPPRQSAGYLDLGSTLTKKKCTIGGRDSLKVVPRR